MSPLAITGMSRVCLMAAIVSYSTAPLKPQARVLPCTARAFIPASWAMFAISKPLRWSVLQPVRIFRVTGTSTAATTAVNMSLTN